METKKTGNCLLSIVIPIYKAENYIVKCVESIVSQLDSDMEIVLVDDGSPDNCPIICDDYAKKYSNVSVIHKRNAGSVSARRDGVSSSKGKYVTFVDSDDWVETGYFPKIRTIIEKYQPDLISVTRHYRASEGKVPYIFKESDYVGLFNREMLEKTFFPKFLYKEPFYTFGVSPSACTKVIKRELICRFIFDAPDKIRIGDDMVFTFPCMLHANSIYFTDFGGYFYRENMMSMTHTFDPEEPDRVLCLLNSLSGNLCDANVKNMQFQIDMYSIHILCTIISTLIKRSNSMKEDIYKLEPLLSCEYVKRGLENQLPFKTKLLVFMVREKRMVFLKLLKKYWLRTKKK